MRDPFGSKKKNFSIRKIHSVTSMQRYCRYKDKQGTANKRINSSLRVSIMGYISWTHCWWRQYSVYMRMKRIVPFQNFRRRKVLITGCTFIFFFFIITIFINGKIWLTLNYQFFLEIRLWEQFHTICMQVIFMKCFGPTSFSRIQLHVGQF